MINKIVGWSQSFASFPTRFSMGLWLRIVTLSRTDATGTDHGYLCHEPLPTCGNKLNTLPSWLVILYAGPPNPYNNLPNSANWLRLDRNPCLTAYIHLILLIVVGSYLSRLIPLLWLGISKVHTHVFTRISTHNQPKLMPIWQHSLSKNNPDGLLLSALSSNQWVQISNKSTSMEPSDFSTRPGEYMFSISCSVLSLCWQVLLYQLDCLFLEFVII